MEDSEEVEVLEAPAEETAPESVETDAIDNGEVSPEEEAPAEKQFTQEDLDATVGKRLARERRKWDREHTKTAPAPTESADIKLEDFSTPEEYAEALAEHKAANLVKEREDQAAASQVEDAYIDREEEARDKYQDFEQVAYNPSVKISDTMAASVKSADNGPEIAYFLGNNPKEAERIYKLPQLAQAMAIGRIEATLTKETSKPSKVPAPIKPVGSRGSTEKNTAQMSASEYRKHSREQRLKYG